MNTLSKVFVVVNLVFAVAFCFMTLTLYSKRVDWKAKYISEERAHKQNLADKNRVIAGLEKEKTDLTHALEMKVRDHDELFQANKELNQNLTDANDEKLVARNERRILSERMSANQLELDRRHKHIERMHRIVLTQQQALEFAKKNMQNALSQRMEMENDLNGSRSRLVAVQKEKARLEKDLHHQTWIIQTLVDHGVPVRDLVFGTGAQPQVPIHGKVLAVRPEVNLVMLSVGNDDEVKKGYRFTVYRLEQYIGKVEVEKVFSDMCSARILPDWTKEEVKEGDDASTRFGGG